MYRLVHPPLISSYRVTDGKNIILISVVIAEYSPIDVRARPAAC